MKIYNNQYIITYIYITYVYTLMSLIYMLQSAGPKSRTCFSISRRSESKPQRKHTRCSHLACQHLSTSLGKKLEKLPVEYLNIFACIFWSCFLGVVDTVINCQAALLENTCYCHPYPHLSPTPVGQRICRSTSPKLPEYGMYFSCYAKYACFLMIFFGPSQKRVFLREFSLRSFISGKMLNF